MLWRSNNRKNKADEKRNSRIEEHPETPSAAEETSRPAGEAEAPQNDDTQVFLTREELLKHNEEARRMYENIMQLRKSVENLKDSTSVEQKSVGGEAAKEHTGETAEIRAAKAAVLQQARRDAEEARKKAEEARQRELIIQQERQRALEAQKRAALIEEAAEKRRKEAEEAERKAKEVARKKALELMAAEMAAKEQQRKEEALFKHSSATPQEAAAFFGEEMPKDSKAAQEKNIENLDSLKENLISIQEKQGAVLNKISEIAESHTEQLSEVQQVKLREVELTKQQAVEEHEQRLYEQQLRVLKEKAKAEEAAKKELKKRQHKEQVRAERLAKVARKKAERARKADEKEKIKAEKRRIANEKARLEKEAREDAKKGGGIVKVKGLNINTAIYKVPNFLWRDFFGLFGIHKEKKATTEEEKQQLRKEREKRKDAARASAELRSIQRKEKYENSKAGKKIIAFKTYCDEHKGPLLVGFATVLTALVAVSGVFNYCTAYEYSYNGQPLGIVKEKDEVLRITDMVQGALTEEKNIDVVIDVKNDITFKRVSALGDVKIDSSEDILKRLTYMGNLNVKAYGIFVDGRKVGAVADKETAAKVMEDIKDKYSGTYENAEIESAVFIENVEVKKSNTDLEDLFDEKEMVNLLCTSGEKERVHKVVAGETLADICTLYSISEEEVLADNKDVDPKKLEVGSSLVIKQEAPIVTVKITELVTYDKVVEHKTQKKDSADIYEGYTETAQAGSDGLSEVTSRITTVNGEQVEEEALVTTVKKKPVTEIILVGTKERPPTVGSGKYIWPIDGTYSRSSNFGRRWGRLHAGIDLACKQGTNVIAADGGTVVKAGYSGAYGNLIVVDHQNGMKTYYAHNSKLLVKVGDKVFQGQHIAESGNTGRSTGPHLHFEVRVNDVPKNPMNYLP